MKSSKNKIVFFISLILLAIIFALSFPVPAQSDELQAAQTENLNTAVPEDHAVDLAKTIALIETSGTLDCSMTGLSGEKGCHQFLPSTWVAYSKDVYGYVATQTPARAQYVAEQKMRQFITAGYTDRQIFLIWNSGRSNGCSKGINRLGVPYDSCAYVANAMILLSKVMHTK